MGSRETKRPQRRPCRHDDIVGAATDLFLTRGYEQTTMQMVARRAGCSVGHLYQHLAGKRELLEAVVAIQVDTVDRLRREVRSDPRLSPLACLRRQLQLLCNHFCEQPLLIAILTATDVMSSDVPTAFRDRLAQEDAELFRLAVETGEIADGNPQQLAAAYIGVVGSLVNLINATGNAGRFATVPAVVDRLFLEPLVALRSGPASKVETHR